MLLPLLHNIVLFLVVVANAALVANASWAKNGREDFLDSALGRRRNPLSLHQAQQLMEERNGGGRSAFWTIADTAEDDDDDDVEDENADPGMDTDYTYKSICVLDGKPTVRDGFDCRNQVAVGRFRNAINATGWSYLEVESKPHFDADMQAYAAGYLEGVLTQPVLQYHLMNTMYEYCNGYQRYCTRLKNFMRKNMAYIERRLARAEPDDPYWQSVKRAYLQVTGIWHGFSGAAFNKSILFDAHPILMLNSNGDFYELESKFNKSKDPSAEVGGKCSGLVKVAPGNADVFISQVTMSGFQNLLRVLKLYKFAYDSLMFPGHTTSFSGYPGVIYSSDDFALFSSGLTAIETTMKVFNVTLYDEIRPEGQLPCWVRAVTANLLARTAREWCQLFKRHNSGTYNNQWVILDYKQFTPGQELPNNGLLYVFEQMPGHTWYEDMTEYLREKSYFASYNIPFFKPASKISGFEQKGNEFYWFNWTNCPRGRIFARDAHTVVDLDSLTKLMRYNDYTHEQYSRCQCVPPYTAEAAISARGDLNPANGTFPLPGMGHVNHGALDYKHHHKHFQGTNLALAKQLRFRAWSGPTYGNVPPFDWTNSDLAATVKHFGHPARWVFKPVEYRWETPVNN